MSRIAIPREQTGNAVLDRIQDAVRLVANTLSDAVDALTTRVATLERARLGVAPVAMPDASYTLPASLQGYGVLRLTGTLTAGRALTIPGATDALGYIVWVNNATAQTVTVGATTGSGGTVAVATGTSKCLLVFSAGVGALV